MKLWKAKPKDERMAPKSGQEAYQYVFAWTPTVVGGVWVWLELYLEIAEYRSDWNGFRWIVIGRYSPDVDIHFTVKHRETFRY